MKNGYVTVVTSVTEVGLGEYPWGLSAVVARDLLVDSVDKVCWEITPCFNCDHYCTDVLLPARQLFIT